MEPVLTLSDLDNWSFPGTALAVLGHPIKHSISPQMHNSALATMGQTDAAFDSWRYFRFDVPPADLPEALTKLHAAGFLGLNLTVPHKVLAFDLIEHVDPSAQPIGAVNTLKRTATGWHGHNTDGYGLATAVAETLVECLAQGCASLHIANRTEANRVTLIADLAPLDRDIPVAGFAPSDPPHNLPPNALVINATSAGLKPEDPLPIDLATITSPLAVFDMIYNPAETKLLTAAKSRGIPTANGLSMLVHQGACALEIWSEAQVPVSVMHTAVKQSA